MPLSHGGRRLRPPSARLTLCLAGVALAVATGCDAGGQLITLGTQRPPPFRFDPPHPVSELSSPEKNDNPTLTANLLEIFFTSDRGGNSDVWSARRASASQPFGAPTRVDAVSFAGFETSSAISADGLTLWFGTDMGSATADLDIWVSTRPTPAGVWSAPAIVAPLNSAARDVPRPPARGGLVMPLASQRDSPDAYRTYFATREGVSAAWDAPRPIPELVMPGLNVVDAFLTEDGLALFYTAGSTTAAGATPAPGDLYVARRGSAGEPFSIIEPLSDINTTFDDRDPWLSPDGTRFFFVSDRGGVLAIYEAAVRK